MKKLLIEFRDFIMTGNVIDLSVAVILATAVGAVISNFTNGIMMPIVGHFTGGVDFSDLKIILDDAVIGAGGEVVKPENAIMYGKWINVLIDLTIVGFILFLIVKLNSRVKEIAKKKQEDAPAEPEAPAAPSQEDLLAEIRDELKKMNEK
ncbi:MAG: large conductance mechanosensitive channel protein MscL [Brumimicrobium sp.]|nr:large conductance mechanosensitive channel protein MscL [Brumimicrobium sp.]MCO5268209.1 large conductance mechanosensitive channel protein MscL [Brumimicrobium sp.]